MRLATFQTNGGAPRAGARVDGDTRVVEHR
jgi:hypothetical protein